MPRSWPTSTDGSEAVARAVLERTSVNVFHRRSAIKVDLFVRGGSALDAESMDRRQRALQPVFFGPGSAMSTTTG
jgi:hypothetical protein